MLDKIVIREAMERTGELFRMDPEPPPESLKGHLGRGVLGQELEDLAIVFPQIVEGLPRGKVHRSRYHANSKQGGGLA
jgi:hypothetical protein